MVSLMISLYRMLWLMLRQGRWSNPKISGKCFAFWLLIDIQSDLLAVPGSFVWWVATVWSLREQWWIYLHEEVNVFCDLIPSLGANFETLYSELPTEMLTLPSTIWIDEFIDSWMDGQFDEWLCRHPWMDVLTAEWMIDVRTVGYMDVWIFEWIYVRERIKSPCHHWTRFLQWMSRAIWRWKLI